MPPRFPPRAGNPPPDSVRVLAGPGRSEFTEQRSRFIGFAVPVEGEDAARAALADLSRQYHDARHACCAWRLGAPPPPAEYRSDDGEPSGSAGEPILAALRKADVTNAMVVVIRYFGGVKLGTGGLARAYGAAAAEALAAAPVRDLPLGRTFSIAFPYALRHAVSAVLQARGGHPVVESYAVDVTWTVWLPHSGCEGFADALAQATAGLVLPVETGD